MKKIIITILSVFIVLSSLCIHSVFARDVKNPGDLGDVDLNGKINLMDVNITLKAICNWKLDIPHDLEAADVNSDGKVSLIDVAMNLKLLAGWYDIDDGGLKTEFLWE